MSLPRVLYRCRNSVALVDDGTCQRTEVHQHVQGAGGFHDDVCGPESCGPDHQRGSEMTEIGLLRVR